MLNFGRPAVLTLVIVAGLAVPANLVQAQDQWINPGTGVFDFGGNWLDGTAPGTNDSALFPDLNTNYVVLWDDITGNTNNASLIARGSVTFASSSFVGNVYTHNLSGGITVIGNDSFADFGGASGINMNANSFLIRADGAARVRSNSILGLGDVTIETGNLGIIGGTVTNFGETTVGTSPPGGVGTGELLVLGGGQYFGGGIFQAAGQSNSTANIVVSGAGSELTVRNGFFMGSSSSNVSNLEVSIAADMSTERSRLVQTAAQIFGAGASWDTTSLELLDSELSITAGGSVRATGSTGTIRGVGLNAGSIIVDGAGSELFTDSRIHIGGTLQVTDGGLVSTGLSTETASFLFNDGVSELRGTGSRIESYDTRVLGDARLNIDEGGVLATTFFINENVTTLTGADSRIEALSLSVDEGTPSSPQAAHLYISDGGRVETQFARIGASVGNGSMGLDGTITLDGNGALITEFLTVSHPVNPGTGTLNIGTGGLVKVASRTNLGVHSDVNLLGGRFEFGETFLEEFARINAVSGSLAGSLSNDVFRNAAELEIPGSANVDMQDVVLSNTGQLYGATNTGMSIVNNGTMQVVSGERMRFGGNGANQNQINLFGGQVVFGGQLNNTDTGFIAGNGQLIAEAGILNSGVLAFSGDSQIVGDVELNAGGQIVTSGLGTTTSFFDDVIHNGLEIRTGEGNATVFFGGVSGAGDFTGTGLVAFEGDLRPGNSPDVISFEGDVLLGTTATTFVELGGELFGEFDRLEIAGDLQLGGALSVGLLDGFSLSHDMEFVFAVIDGDLTGNFDDLAEGDLVTTFDTFGLFISYQAGSGNDVALVSRSIPEPGALLLLGPLSLAMLMQVRRRRTAHQGHARFNAGRAMSHSIS